MYRPYTTYPGFKTGRVSNNGDGSQYVWVDNVTYWAVIWTDGNESVWIRDEYK